MTIPSELVALLFPLSGVALVMASHRPTFNASESGIDVGAIVEQARYDAGLSHKECWLSCGYRNASTWSRALNGEPGYPMDLHRIKLLPPKFWYHFMPLLMKAFVRQWMTDLWEDVNVFSRNAGAQYVVQSVSLGVRGESDPVRAVVGRSEPPAGGVERGSSDSRVGVRRVG